MQEELEGSSGADLEENLPTEDLAQTLPMDGPRAAQVGDLARTMAMQEDRVSSASLPSERIEKLASQSNTQRRYEVTGEVGRGGMGAVLQVFDADLRRTLAMKVILERVSGTEGPPEVAPQVLARFLEEAQVTGQLDHPGVVPVHELGVDSEGRAYFTMPLVRGRELKDVIESVHAGKDDWSLTRVLGVMLKVCETMSFAHDKGVVHRDLKPANVMVGEYGEVYVMDWGLARVLNQEDAHDLRLKPSAEPTPARVRTDRKDASSTAPTSVLMTMDGAIMGTPCYMAPEQARGDIDAIGPASDVYAAGAMLYHLLTGHMPYYDGGKSITAYEVVELVRNEPPRPVQKLAPKVPPELVAICERAMEREPARRYADMKSLAGDLRAFLENRVVQAHRTGPIAELRKWFQRNRALALTALASGLVIICGSLASSFFYRDQRDRAVEAERNEGHQRAAADLARMEATEQRDEARERLVRAHSQSGSLLRESGDALGGGLWFAEALRSADGFPRLADIQRRRLAWQLANVPELVLTAQREVGVESASLSPDGTRLLSNHMQHGSVLWDLEAGTVLAHFPGAEGHFSDDASTIGLLTHLMDEVEDDTVMTRISGADGRTGRLLGGSKEVAGPATWRGSVAGGRGFFVEYGSWDEDDKSILRWDVATGSPAAETSLGLTDGSSFQTSDDGKVTVARGTAYGSSNDLVVFRPDEGRVTQTIEHSSRVQNIVLAGDGRTVATSFGSQLQVWNTATGKAYSSVLDHGEEVEYMCYSGKTGYVIAASTQESWDEENGEQVSFELSIWNVTPGADPAQRGFADDAMLQAVELTPDGRTLVAMTVHPQYGEDTASETIHVAYAWDLDSGELKGQGFVRAGDLDWSDWIGFLPDGRFVTTAPAWDEAAYETNTAATIWDPRQPDLGPNTFELTSRCDAVGFDASGSRVVVIPEHGSVDTEHELTATVLDLSSTAPVALAVPQGAEAYSIALHPLGDQAATACDDGVVRVFDVATGQPALPPIAFDGPVFRVAYSPDGSLLLAGGRDNTARLFDARDGAPFASPIQHEDAVDELGFSEDGSIAWTSSRDGSARVIDTRTGEVISTFNGSVELGGLFDNSVQDIAMDNTGRRVLVVRADGDATRLYDYEAREVVINGFDTYGDQRKGAFSPDGTLLATGGGDSIRGEVRTWDASTGAQLGRVMLHEAAVTSLVFSPDGRLIGSADWNGTARLWDTRTGEPATPPLRHEGAVRRLRFSPDGALFVTACEDGAARVWSTHTGELLLEPLVHRDEKLEPVPVKDALFGPGANFLVTLPADGAAPRVWNLAPDQRSKEHLMVLAELQSGRKVNAMGSLSELSDEEVADRLQRLATFRAGASE